MSLSRNMNSENLLQETIRQRLRFAAGLIGLCVVACLILAYFNPAPVAPKVLNNGIPDPNRDPVAAGAYVKTLAQRNGGDFDRLTEDERIFLNSLAHGHGRDLLAKTARELKPSAASHPTTEH